ncbi:thiamine phosphate synthase [Swingsia samuiensis]|uniref:Thiamine phosphate synthase n=1 Tax=Swingsia samuiensis TaxID=1293412 RepID=A0A4Y6UIZ3_9PROT|nr:thiamine phosphate synthase [Swingsia samuiensis]QDH16351.1 thiamine phosphate synthase [Swingsia samuiensis]
MTAFDLYPTLPLHYEIKDALKFLPPLLSSPNVSALRLSFSTPLTEDHFFQLRDILHQNDVALILDIGENKSPSIPPYIYKSLDGLHSSLAQNIQHLRKTTPENIQLGCFCHTRDEAMQAGESGADYISFGLNNLDLIKWWGSVMELPTVAEAITSTKDAINAKTAQADFLSFALEFDGKDTDKLSHILSAT